jgi:hypothetical protein
MWRAIMPPRDPRTYAIIEAAMKVHRVLGCGFLEAQTINTLKATGIETGLLLNLGAKSLEHKRFVHSSKRSASDRGRADR